MKIIILISLLLCACVFADDAIIVDLSTGTTTTRTETAVEVQSRQDVATANSNEMARAASTAAREAAIAAELNLTTNQVIAVKEYFTNDVDVIFSNLNASQRKFLKVQQGLLRYLAKDHLKEKLD